MDRDIKQRTFGFGLQIINMYQKLPKTGVGFILGKQLIRSGTSIGANVEEADNAISKKEFSSKISISYKEAGCGCSLRQTTLIKKNSIL